MPFMAFSTSFSILNALSFSVKCFEHSWKEWLNDLQSQQTKSISQTSCFIRVSVVLSLEVTLLSSFHYNSEFNLSIILSRKQSKFLKYVRLEWKEEQSISLIIFSSLFLSSMDVLLKL